MVTVPISQLFCFKIPLLAMQSANWENLFSLFLPLKTKTGICLLQDGNQEPFKVRLHLAKDILMIQEQDVICVSGEPFYSGVSSFYFFFKMYFIESKNILCVFICTCAHTHICMHLLPQVDTSFYTINTKCISVHYLLRVDLGNTHLRSSNKIMNKLYACLQYCFSRLSLEYWSHWMR